MRTRRRSPAARCVLDVAVELVFDLESLGHGFLNEPGTVDGGPSVGVERDGVGVGAVDDEAEFHK